MIQYTNEESLFTYNIFYMHIRHKDTTSTYNNNVFLRSLQMRKQTFKCTKNHYFL